MFIAQVWRRGRGTSLQRTSKMQYSLAKPFSVDFLIEPKINKQKRNKNSQSFMILTKTE